MYGRAHWFTNSDENPSGFTEEKFQAQTENRFFMVTFRCI